MQQHPQDQRGLFQTYPWCPGVYGDLPPLQLYPLPVLQQQKSGARRFPFGIWGQVSPICRRHPTLISLFIPEGHEGREPMPGVKLNESKHAEIKFGVVIVRNPMIQDTDCYLIFDDQLVQNTVTGLLTGARNHDPTTLLLIHLNQLPVNFEALFKITYKAPNGLGPWHLKVCLLHKPALMRSTQVLLLLVPLSLNVQASTIGPFLLGHS